MPSAPARCEVCGGELAARVGERSRAGRPARYCSSACRQRAYRQRAADHGRGTPTAEIRYPDAGIPPPLTGREHELVRLVADGFTNRQIAGRLSATERTVEAELRTVRGKLGLRSRAQLAAWTVAWFGDDSPL